VGLRECLFYERFCVVYPRIFVDYERFRVVYSRFYVDYARLAFFNSIFPHQNLKKNPLR
jgi:hypothetical protein